MALGNIQIGPRLLRAVQPSLIVLLFLLSAYVLHRELHDVSMAKVIDDIHAVSNVNILQAVLLTAASYFLLSFYDALGLRYVNFPLSYSKTGLSSFLSFALSHNLGLPFITGGAMRYRLLTPYGVKAADIVRIVAFNALIFLLGYLLSGGLVFTFGPSLPALLHFRFDLGLRLFGSVLLVVFLLLLFLAFRRMKINLLGQSVLMPSPGLMSISTIVATCDWILAAAVAYVLLPHTDFNFVWFLGLFLLAQGAGLLSNIPGGVGVFEGLVVSAMPHSIPSSSVFAALLLYRLIYYIIPFVIGLAIILVIEIYARRHAFAVLALPIRGLLSLRPLLMTAAVFGSGFLLLLSGATSAETTRFAILAQYVPLAVVEASHFFGSICGACLLILAQGLRRRVKSAYALTIVALVSAIILSLLKGFDYEEAIALLVILAAFIPTKDYYFREAALFERDVSLRLLVSITIALLVVIFLLFFAYKHVEYSHNLWWQIEINSHVSRSLRATLASAIIILFWSLHSLLTPVKPNFGLDLNSCKTDILQALQNCEYTHGFLSLMGDKKIFLSHSGKSFLMFGISGHVAVAMGDPIGQKSEAHALIWDFYEQCRMSRLLCAFYEIGEANLSSYIELGLRLYKLGEEAFVQLETFSLEGKARSNLRHTWNKFHKDGYQFEIIPEHAVPTIVPRLEEISKQWLAQKSTREKGFSLGFFSADYLKNFSIAVVRHNGLIVAFANIWAANTKTELSVDLMRYSTDAKSGVMEYLFIELMLWGRANAYKRFSLGMAPLSGFEQRRYMPIWNKLACTIFRHGEHFYNFQGLRDYKEKFDPFWEDRYLVSAGGLSLPLVFTALTSLVSRGLGGIYRK